MRLMIGLLLALAILSPANSEESHKRLAAADITSPPSAARSQETPPKGPIMTIVVPGTPVVSSAIAAAAALDQGRAGVTQSFVSAQSTH